MVEASGVPRPPRSLKTRGRALWRQLYDDYEPEPHEADLVLEVCRTLDTIDQLSAAIAADGLMILGSQGQRVLHPAVAELRQQQALYARLVPMLNLDEGSGGVGLATVTSLKAKTAANARWSKSKDARRA